jgi:BA14K-like protein
VTLSTKIKLSELVRRGCTVLLAAPLLLSAVPASSQSTGDRWQAERRLAVTKLRDCVAAFAEQKPDEAQDENSSALLIAAIERDCRSAFDGMIQLFGQHIDAKAIELQLQAITETTLLPAMKGKRAKEISSADVSADASQNPTSQIPDPALTTPVVVPDSADRRRALKESARANRDSPPKFSQEWLEHCRAKYNSFNPRTGKYKSYGGVYRSCR